jgi:protein-disulfide isomerase
MIKMSFSALIFACAIASTIALPAYCQTRSAAASGSEKTRGILATVDGRTISQEATDSAVDQQLYSLREQLYSLQEKIYNLRKSALDRLIDRTILELEASRRRLSVEDLRNQLTPGKTEVKQSEVDKAYAEHRGTFASVSEDEAKLRIRMDLETAAKLEAYKGAVAALKQKANIEIFLSAPVPPILAINAGGPSKGGDNAPITIVEFADFECPYCAKASGVLKQVLETYGREVKLVFKHMPLAMHQHAFKAAQASVCAANQGRFWEYHDLLFEGAGDLSVESLRKYARDLGLKAEAFDACMNSGSSSEAVNEDLAEARRVGVQGTPSFFINGRYLRDASGLEDFKAAINKELAKDHVVRPAGPSTGALPVDQSRKTARTMIAGEEQR